nr:MAG TPA: hypothetical protein [Caudoviricetes sp.]
MLKCYKRKKAGIMPALFIPFVENIPTRPLLR